MRPMRVFAAALALPMLVAARPLAAPVPHTIDRAHSEINFVADSRMLSAHGFFAKWDADVALDPKNWEASTVAITIDASSINTRVEMRDKHLRSDDFLAVDKFPTITFKSVEVKKSGESKLDITGDLTVRGTTKRVVVPATLVFYEGTTGRFRGHFAINRKDYGIAYNSAVNPIQDEVQVQWDIALKQPTTTPAPAK
ncbi:MAG: YceI family protein [Gemmatimonadota bacterium]